jgi:hypothetical protein
MTRRTDGKAPPRVSVLLPVRNGEEFLAPALDSVLSQTLAELELIVVDDGSTDSTADILAGYEDPRMRVVQGQGKGISRALNLALQHSTAPYVARMDADDESLPERFARQVSAMDADPALGLIASSFEVIDPDGAHVAYRGVPLDDGALRSTLTGWSPFCHGSVMMRRAVLMSAGGYDPGWEPAEDYELWVRLAQQTRFAALPEVLYRHRSSPGGVSATRGERQRDQARAVVQRARQLTVTPPDTSAVAAALAALPGDAPHRTELIEATLAAAELRARHLGSQHDRSGAVRAWWALITASLSHSEARRILLRRAQVLIRRRRHRRGRVGSTGT